MRKDIRERGKNRDYTPIKNMYIPKEAGHIWDAFMRTAERENKSQGQLFVEMVCRGFGIKLPDIKWRKK